MYQAADYDALLKRLSGLSEEKYRLFNQSLMPGTTCRYGVRVPILRGLAKEIAAEDWRGYLAVARDETHTERMLQGLVVAYAKCDPAEKQARIAAFVPLIDNWAVCDTFSSTLKCVKRDLAEYWFFLQRYFNSEQEFAIRFAVVTGMDYYINEEYIVRYLAKLKHIRHEGYYVKMAVAWALSFCFIGFADKTLRLLEERSLDAFTQNKAIQKCRESYRVSKENKELLLSYRIIPTGTIETI